MSVIFRRFLSISFLLACACEFSAYAQEDESLVMHGLNYPNACSVAEKNKLKEMLTRARVVEEAQLWRALDTILCAPDNDVTRAYLRSLVPAKVREDIESTGDKPSVKMMARNEKLIGKLIAAGKAWDATVEEDQFGHVTLQYFADEACVKGTTFAHANSKWYVYQIGQACD